MLHLHSAYSLTVINKKARPQEYQSKRDYVAADFASRTMRWTGIIVLLYLVFHLMDLTWGNANAQFVRGDPYNNLVYSLQRPAVAAVYVIANIALAFHLYHGAWSMFQSMGVNNPRINKLRRIVRNRVRRPHPRRQPQLPDPRAGACHEAEVPAHRTRDRTVQGGLTMALDSKIPAGPLEEKWDNHKFDIKLVNPANKRRFDIIVVGTGLAGASAAASLAELGYNVKVVTFHDSPRRAHSIAAQGGINAAKNYKNDGDSVYRLFYDTIKGGDYRAREANVYRLAQVSVDIIDQCVAQGVPFAREYGGLLDNRSFGGAQVSRTFYARGQTGQQLLLGAYQALMRAVHSYGVQLYPRTEMLDVVVKDGQDRRHRVPRPEHRRSVLDGRGTRSCSPPAATATRSICRPTPRTRTSPRRGAPRRRARTSRTPATRRSTPRASPRATSSRASSR